jgi:N-acetyl-anhydromuramyl-L-alanine amidase AmpD
VPAAVERGARAVPPAPERLVPERVGSGDELVRPGAELARRGDEIVACGRLFHAGTKVVLWTDPGGYDAYRAHRWFEPDVVLPSDGNEAQRFGSFRRGLEEALAARVRAGGWRLEDLRAAVGQIVLHYDACGTSAQCFRVLHDVRGLSSHFLLDVDGTVYQTLDLKERAWHAGAANDRSIGIEIANIGAYADPGPLDPFYEEVDGVVRLRIPDGIRRGALPADPDLSPRRPGLVEGRVHGRDLYQRDFTSEQYEALARLLAALSRVLAGLPLEAPRDEQGAVIATLLDDERRATFRGVVGHFHWSAGKVDPGPAFDWDAVLARARALAASDGSPGDGVPRAPCAPRPRATRPRTRRFHGRVGVREVERRGRADPERPELLVLEQTL